MSKSIRGSWRWAVVALVPWWTACPPTGVVCRPGTEACGTGCADFASDPRNCGACGRPCQAGEVCQEGACGCLPGASRCEGACVATSSSPSHCGGCAGAGGVACAADQVCEGGVCKADCALGVSARCGQSCVNLLEDPLHCGACDAVCPDNQSCRQGACGYDAVAACRDNGQVVGVTAASGLLGPARPLGTTPSALAAAGGVLLAADDANRQLVQASLPSLGDLGQASAVGDVPNQVYAADGLVFVVNAGSSTLQILAADGGTGSGALALSTVGEVNFGAGTWPEGVVKLGSEVFVPLYGDYAGSGGQKVARVDVSNPAAPAVVGAVDLGALDLQTFDGGASLARPFAVTVFEGQVVVALNNLDAAYQPAGPGMLAVLDPGTGAVRALSLGADRCLNPVWLSASPDGLYVGCAGRAFDASYTPIPTERSGVVRVSSLDGGSLASWNVACPAGASTADCPYPSVGRLAVVGRFVVAADQSAGRLFLLESVDGGLVERRGPLSGGALQACPKDPARAYSNVSDVVALP